MENQNLSNRIKNFRILKGFSQEALAEHSGLSVRTIQRMENNDRIPNADSLKKVRKERLELSHLAAPEPKSGASTNSATSAT